MEKEELIQDDFLKQLIQGSPLDSPSDNFVDNVMNKILADPVIVPVKRPFYHYFKSAVPNILLGVLCIMIIITSDFPFIDRLYWKAILMNSVLPYFHVLFAGFDAIFSSKYFSYALMIAFAGLLLIIIDLLFSRKSFHNQIA